MSGATYKNKPSERPLGGAIYEFLERNHTILTTIENFLRSLSYLIPGRFADSELAAEILYAILNLLRLTTDTVLERGRIHRHVGDATLKQTAWNNYLAFLRRQSRAMDMLLGFLNVTWTVQVPLEMIVQRLLGLPSKMRLILALELLKATARLLVFWKGHWRPVLRNYVPDILRLPLGSNKSAKANSARASEGDYDEDDEQTNSLLTEIKLADNKEEEGIHNFLRKHRLDQYVLVPELCLFPARGLLEKWRETSHIIRPLIYSASLVLTSRKNTLEKVKWASWIITMAMDLFAEWPQLMILLNVNDKKKEIKLSPIESDERQVRLIRLLLYLLRNPFYHIVSKPYLDSVIETLSKWKLLKPFIETAASYQKLCEKVVYYTLGS